VAQAAATSEGSPLQVVTHNIQSALENLMHEASNQKAVEVQVTRAAEELRLDVAARRELESRATGAIYK
jgi:nitrogen fixation/metabolism regulation signal transduction histidine kinase